MDDKLITKDYIIHYGLDEYPDGNNLLFSIEFPNYRTRKGYIQQTGWYNDNHEFGNEHQSKESSIKLANWYIEDIKRIHMIDSGYHDPKYFKYRDELSNFLNSII